MCVSSVSRELRNVYHALQIQSNEQRNSVSVVLYFIDAIYLLLIRIRFLFLLYLPNEHIDFILLHSEWVSLWLFLSFFFWIQVVVLFGYIAFNSAIIEHKWCFAYTHTYIYKMYIRFKCNRSILIDANAYLLHLYTEIYTTPFILRLRMKFKSPGL